MLLQIATRKRIINKNVFDNNTSFDTINAHVYTIKHIQCHIIAFHQNIQCNVFVTVCQRIVSIPQQKSFIIIGGKTDFVNLLGFEWQVRVGVDSSGGQMDRLGKSAPRQRKKLTQQKQAKRLVYVYSTFPL